MRSAIAPRLFVLGFLLLSSSCAPDEDERPVRHVGDGNGDGGGGQGGFIIGDGDGDGDTDGGGDGDGDGDAGEGGPFTYEVIPEVREAKVLAPIDLSDDGHVLLYGDDGDETFSMLFIWDGGATLPRQIELPSEYVLPWLLPARLLTGDRIALALRKRGRVVYCIIEGDEVTELQSPVPESVLMDANNAGQIVVSAIDTPSRTWLLAEGEEPLLIEEDDVTGLTDDGIVGFSSGYWQDEELNEDAFELGFVGVSGPSTLMTVLGFDGLPSDDESPVAIWSIDDDRVEPIEDLREARGRVLPIHMLPNGEYVVAAPYGTRNLVGHFLFHDDRYELLVTDDDIHLTVIASNAAGDLVTTSLDEDYSAVIVRPR